MTKPTIERTLLLLRHAKAEQAPGKPDHERKLAPRGRKDARAVASGCVMRCKQECSRRALSTWHCARPPSEPVRPSTWSVLAELPSRTPTLTRASTTAARPA